MAAVIGNQTSMVRWLLRRGRIPGLRTRMDLTALLLAVREGKPGAVGGTSSYRAKVLIQRSC